MTLADVERLADGLAARLRLARECGPLRRAVGMSQTELARAVDVPNSTLCRWETGAARCTDPYAAARIMALLDAVCDRITASTGLDPRDEVRGGREAG